MCVFKTLQYATLRRLNLLELLFLSFFSLSLWNCAKRINWSYKTDIYKAWSCSTNNNSSNKKMLPQRWLIIFQGFKLQPFHPLPLWHFSVQLRNKILCNSKKKLKRKHMQFSDVASDMACERESRTCAFLHYSLSLSHNECVNTLNLVLNIALLKTIKFSIWFSRRTVCTSHCDYPFCFRLNPLTFTDRNQCLSTSSAQ